MHFEIRRIRDVATLKDEWAIIPLFGQFEGLRIACADGVCLRDVKFSGKVLSGDLTAVWGITLNETVYADHTTLKALKLGKTFDMRPSDKLHTDIEGYLDRGNRVVRSADAATVIGEEVYVKGAHQ